MDEKVGIIQKFLAMADSDSVPAQWRTKWHERRLT